MISLLFGRQNRNFQRLWWAQLISQFGDRVNQLALVGLIAGRVPGSAMELAKLLAFTIVPVFLIQPFAGVFVDRWDRRTTLFVCDAARGALVLLIPFALFYSASMASIYIVVFLAFCFSRFYSPAKMSILPDLVAGENLLMANSLVTTTGMIAFVLGCALGGFIVDRYGARMGFIIDGATFFISGALVFSIDLSRKLKISRANFFKASREFIGPIRRSVWGELGEGMRYLAGHRELRFTLGVIFAMLAAAGAVYVVIIVFIQESFQSVTRDLGVLAVFLGLGLFTGALVYGRWGRRFVWYKTMFFSLMAGGAFLIAFALLVRWDPRISSALLLAFFLGLVIGPIFITANMIVQVVSDDAMRGKVFSALEVVIHLAFLAAMLVSSWLAEFTPKVWILVGAGILCAGTGLIGLGMKHRLAALPPAGPPDSPKATKGGPPGASLAKGGLRKGQSRGIINSGQMADLFDK